MSKQKDREEFVIAMAREGVPLDVARKVMRCAATIQRLAEAQCNGDWPCDNGGRRVKPCVRCQVGYVPGYLLKGGLCPDCRAADRIVALLAPYSVVPDFQGDPRGACVKLRVPSGRTDDWGQTGLCVPA